MNAIPTLPRFFVHALATVILLLCSQSLWAALDASVDRTQVARNESLTLTLRYDGQSLGDPDFSDLERDFEILSNQRQSHFALGSGGGESRTTWVLGLMPKRTGKLVIPSFHFKGDVSNAFEVEVSEPQRANAGERPVFAEAELDQGQVHTNQQALLTLRFTSAIDLRDLGMSELEIAGVDLVRLGDNQYRKTIDGRPHTVVEVRYALFPRQPGTVEIPPVRFSGIAPDPNDPFGGSLLRMAGRRVTVATDSLSLEVQPKPGNAPPGPWLPAQGLSLAQRWSRPPDELVVGEPITRNLIVSAQGQQATQLPPLDIEAGDGFKLYPDQPELENQTDNNGLIGKRTESMAIVPTRAGQLTLPAIEVQWWDAVSGQPRTTRLGAVTVNVKPAPGSEVSAPVVETASEPPANFAGSTWLVAILAAGNLILLILVLTFAALWWRNRSQPQASGDIDTGSDQDEAAAFRQVEQASADKPSALRQAVLRWARYYWPDADILTLGDICAEPGCKPLTPLFEQLDRALYGSGDIPFEERDRLIEHLRKIRAERRQRRKRQTSSLAPLYPD